MTARTDRLNIALADRYRIERELGAGGMATVYLARDLRHDRDVAVKVLREDLAASLGGGRFLREIKIAAQLQHPNILPLLDSGEADGFLFFVMPYIRGQSLRERLARDGELPVHEAVRLVTEVVDALVEAHAHGVVHRDIKPDNVMLSGRHALVTDFGVAKAVSEATGRHTVTTFGVALGTPAYMSPEQAAADPHVDHRSDIYSVGVMAYEMICGRPPFTSTTPQQVLSAHMTQAPDPPSKWREAISPALEQVIMTCLAKRAADRYQSASDLFAALEPLATPSTGITPASTRPMAPGRRWKSWGIGVGAVIGAVAAVAIVWKTRSPSPAAPASFERVQLSTSGYASRPLLSPDGRQVAYTEQPCAPDATTCPQRLVVQDVATGVPLVLIDSVFAVQAVEWSRSGDWIIVTLAKSGEATMSPFAIISHLGGTPAPLPGAATFSPRGDTAIVADGWLVRRDRPIWLRTYVAPWTQPLDSVAVQPPAHAMALTILTASPTDPWIAANWALAGEQEGVLTINDRQGRQAASRAGPLDWLGTWSVTGTALLQPIGARGQTALQRLQVDRRTGAFGTSDTIPLGTSAGVSRVTASADGAAAAYDEITAGAAEIWTLASTAPGGVPQKARRLISGADVTSADIAPDGDVVVYSVRSAGGAQFQRQYFAAPFGGGSAHAVTPPLPQFVGAHITSDGRRLVVRTRSTGTSSLLTSYDLATGRVAATTQRADTGFFVSAAGGGDVAMVTSRHVTILNESLAETREIAIPDSLGHLAGAFGAPGGSGIGLMSYPPDLAALVGSDFNVHLPLYMVTAVGAIQREWLVVAYALGRLWWQRDGSLVVPAIMAGDFQWALYRVPPEGGPQRRIGPLPIHDALDMDLSADGRRGVVLVTPRVSNIWLVRNFTAMVR